MAVTTLQILIVDDDAAISELLAEILRADGHTICGIESTEDGAVSAASRLGPDLMIIDMTLAEGNGADAIARIGRTGHIPHVLMSGRRLPPGTAGLSKPFGIAELRREIGRATDRRGEGSLSTKSP